MLSVVAAALAYCIWRCGRLIALAWLPCAMESATRFALDEMVSRSNVPAWLLSPDFEPQTWLAAVLVTPWAAASWSLVLQAMAEETSGRQKRTSRGGSAAILRLLFSASLFAAAAIFSVVNLVDGVLRFAERKLFLLVDPALSDTVFALIGFGTVTAHAAFMALLIAFTYPLAGLILRTRTLDRGQLRRSLPGNIARLTAIFFVLTIILALLDQLLRPAESWLVHLVVASPSLGETGLRYLVDFPLSMLMIAAWAATVGIVLGKQPEREGTLPARASARPLPRPDDFRPFAK